MCSSPFPIPPERRVTRTSPSAISRFTPVPEINPAIYGCGQLPCGDGPDRSSAAPRQRCDATLVRLPRFRATALPGESSRSLAITAGKISSALSTSASVLKRPNEKRMLPRVRSGAQFHRAQDVRRLERSGAAGRAGGATKLMAIEQHERRVRFDPGKGKIRSVRQARVPISIYERVRHSSRARRFKSIAHRANARRLLRQRGRGAFRRFPQRDDGSDVFRSGAPIVLLAPADQARA